MAKTKLAVKTDIGTFTRTTVRTYTHLVVAKGYRAEVLEAARQGAIKNARKQLAQYEAVLAGDTTVGIRTNDPVATAWDIECRDKSLADGSYVRWAQGERDDIAQLEARGVITEDGNSWSDYNPNYSGAGQPAEWQVLGWCGRPDLAAKLAEGKDANRFREVRIYAIDGTRVR